MRSLVHPLTATWFVPALALALSASCLRQTEFRCATSDQCGEGGTCEPVGYCSYADGACQRFAASAGPYANQCVGDAGSDAGIDAPGDAPGDAPAAGCPAGYDPLSGGGAHRYRKLTAAASWAAQRTACMQAGAPRTYLAIPDDAAELAALTSLAGTVPYWIGLSDTAAEGTFVTVLGGAPFPGWATGQPDNGPPDEDCAAASTAGMTDERCNDARIAICECAP